MAEETVNYRAKSSYVSKTIIMNVLMVIAVVLESQEITNILPPEFMPFVPMIMGLVNIILRQYTVRPVSAKLMPGQSIPVAVEKLA